MKKKTLIYIIVLFIPLLIFGARRFPQPEFEKGYSIPTIEHPDIRSDLLEYLDVAILFLALSLSAYLGIKKRSRNGMLLLTVFSVIYFGFYRKGCICPVGSIQNVTLSLFNGAYIVPLAVLLFFLLPLVFALFFGRVFCGSVCPLGALQEMIIYRPVRLPVWLREALGLIPYLYLGLAALFAATNTSFIICKYDPFIPIYRLSGPFWILIITAIILISGIFIPRIYCRFLCPYGVLLGWMSRFSKFHLKITPDECIQCKLCEDSCPVDAIDYPMPQTQRHDNANKITDLRKLLFLTPAIIVLSGWGVSLLSPVFSGANKTVALAEQILQEENDATVEQTPDSKAYRSREKTIDELYKEAENIQKKFMTGSRLLGIFVGTVISLKLAAAALRRTGKDYEPNRMSCVSCGRCMNYCPVEPKEKES